MSRVGKNPIIVPNGVEVNLLAFNEISVKGPMGELTRAFNSNISISFDDSVIKVTPNFDSVAARAMWGTARSIINSMLIGVSRGFVQEVEMKGVGFRGSVDAGFISLFLGKSHGIKIEIPSEISLSFTKPNLILIKSCNKESLGQFISLLISQRAPEPYKGRGVFIKGSYIEFKKAKKSK